MTNTIKNVCITDEQSIPYNATNSTELLDFLKEQILEKVKRSCNLGKMGEPNQESPLVEIAFTYDNPQIVNGKLYVDLKILGTPQGKVMEELNDYRVTTAIHGFIRGDKSIECHGLYAVYVDTPSTDTTPLD